MIGFVFGIAIENTVDLSSRTVSITRQIIGPDGILRDQTMQRQAAIYQGQPESKSNDQEILYWAAPMDPNYRRNKPGKSPMGMDLVPVYKDG